MFSSAASNLALSRAHSSRAALAATSGLGAVRIDSSVRRSASEACRMVFGVSKQETYSACTIRVRHKTYSAD